MLPAIHMDETIEYVSVMDKGKEHPTVFLLGALNGKDRLMYMSKFEDSPDPASFYEIVKRGLRGIKNLGGKDYPVIDDAALNAIPTGVLKELFLKLVEINFMSEQETKN